MYFFFQLDQTSLGMPDRTYLVRGLNDSSTAAYYQLMVKSAKLLGANEDIVEKELLKALHFEMALANVSDFICEAHSKVSVTSFVTAAYTVRLLIKTVFEFFVQFNFFYAFIENIGNCKI